MAMILIPYSKKLFLIQKCYHIMAGLHLLYVVPPPAVIDSPWWEVASASVSLTEQKDLPYIETVHFSMQMAAV